MQYKGLFAQNIRTINLKITAILIKKGAFCMDMNIKKSSLKHQIAEKIRQEIFRGKINPGDKVVEAKIAENFEVSRGPVREAVQILVMEGLLVSTAYKETKVSTITTEEVTELLIPMRVKMETFALKKGYPLWNQKHFDKFEEALEQMRRATIFNDLPLFNDLDIQFHELIIQSSNMTSVVNLWEGVSNRIRLHFTYQNKLSQSLQKFTEDHRILLESLKTGDIDAAVEGLKDHIIESNTPDVQLLPEQNDTPHM